MKLFERVINYRTRYITVVLEDAFQAQNASAVIRTCDCFGIQDIHFIESQNEFKLDRNVTLGSHKWLNLISYREKANNTAQALKHIRNQGYRIIATTLDKNNISLHDLDPGKGKLALIYGNERDGLTPEAIKNADEFVRIPMYGFTKSYNLSVAVALTLQDLVERLHKLSREIWQLKEEERIEIIITWMRKSIRNAELIEKRFPRI
jgi:tRNA (guanosine-2'-O-)-methyltransferase